MADQQADEAAWDQLKSFQETNQAITEHIVTAQERATQFAQRFFNEGLEVLKANQETAQSIVTAQEHVTEVAQRFFTEGT